MIRTERPFCDALAVATVQYCNSPASSQYLLENNWLYTEFRGNTCRFQPDVGNVLSPTRATTSEKNREKVILY